MTFDTVLIGRTPGIHWWHFYIDTVENREFLNMLKFYILHFTLSPSTAKRRPQFAAVGRGFILEFICFRKAAFFILHRIDMEVTPMDSLCFSDENHTKFHVNPTIFYEVRWRLWKSIFHLIFFIMLRIASFLVLVSSAKHKESIDVVFAEIWWEMRNSKISHFLIVTPTPSRIESHKIRWGTARVVLATGCQTASLWVQWLQDHPVLWSKGSPVYEQSHNWRG